MVILFIIRTLGRGGAERQLTLLAKELKLRGHLVNVAILYGGGDFEAELLDVGIRVVNLKKKGRWDVLRFYIRYVELLREVMPDILHGYMPMQNLLATFGGQIVKNVKVVWGVRDSSIGHGKIPFSARFVFWLCCKLSRFSHLIISNSQAGKQLYTKSGCPGHLIHVIPNGIDSVRFRRNEEARRYLRQHWGISDDQVLIGCVGRLDPAKDHATYIRACAYLLEECPNAAFVCVGGGGTVEYEASLKALADQLKLSNRLIWAGEYQDMVAVYSALDVLVSSSLHEGFPNVIAEAMGCEVPVVATSVGDVELILDGVGICVPPGDPIALATGMKAMLARDLCAAGKASRERIVERYSVEKLTERTETLLNALFEGKDATSLSRLRK